jgi:Glucose-6-phosphate dehydrogenase, NAD binding domain
MKLDGRLRQAESRRKKADRIFYLSIPPSIFTQVARSAAEAASSTWAPPLLHSPDQPALVSRLVNEKRSKPNLKKAEAWPCFSCCFGIWSLSCAIRRAMCQAHTQRYLINQSHMVVCVCGGGGHFEVGIGGPA